MINELGSVLKFKYPNDFLVNIEVSDEGNGPFISKWNMTEDQPTQAELITYEKEYLDDKSITAINKIAYSKIILIAPEYKQRNMTARSLELVDKELKGNILTAEEQAEKDGIEYIWNRVKAIRSHSNTLVQSVLNGDTVNINEGWPE